MNIVQKRKIIHFVTGGFSGSTSIAIQLVNAAKCDPTISSLLVLRKKSSTNMAKVQELISQGLSVRLVPGWSHIATIVSLIRLCYEFKPDVIVCHGFSEHIWGRYAGLFAQVPHLVHVEHNSKERYTPWKLAQARWLTKFTAKIIACSEGVKKSLLDLNFPSEKILTISNGIDLTSYQNALAVPFEKRQAGIVMAARFSKQKDHISLILAIDLLRKKGIFPIVHFAGKGCRLHRKKAYKLAAALNLLDQIKFLGYCNSLPELYLHNQICVLSTHHEGMPLVLCEGMAAGCAVVGSDVIGVRELIKHGKDGLLVDENSPESLADALEKLLTSSEFSSQLATTAYLKAHENFGLPQMISKYNEILISLMVAPQHSVIRSK
jgi:glycosyltransferase involved in cell wall biosynthesis